MAGNSWKIVAEEYDCSPMIHVATYCVAATSGIEKYIGENDNAWMFGFNKSNFSMVWAGDLEVYEKHSRMTLSKLEDRAFFETLDSCQRKTAKAVFDYADFLSTADLSSCSNAELYGAFDRLFSLFVEMNVFGHLINLPDFETNLFSNKITTMLEPKTRKAGITVAEAFSVLTTPNEKSFMQQQDEDFCKLLMLAQENDPSFENALNAHAKKYDWLQFHYDGPTLLDKLYFQQVIESELKQGIDGRQKLVEAEAKAEALKQKQAGLYAVLSLDENEKYWLEVAKAFLFLKGLRKDAVFYGHRHAERLFVEIGKRLGISVKEVKHLTRSELKQSLENACVDKKLLAERLKFMVMYVENGLESIYAGQEADEYWAKVKQAKVSAEVTEIKGTPACPGFVRGVVKFVARVEDIPKMNQGDILISFATNPNLVPAMKKAGAIVTDEGGITCHAAIVSRELGIPCVVGTKVATKWLKDGDLIEVDATNGIVRKL